MPRKATVAPRFLTLADASTRFEKPDQLIALLREGSLVARGRLGRFSNDPMEFSAETADIPASAWSDYTLTANHQLNDGYENFYEAIEIETVKLEAVFTDLQEDASKPKGNRGGRPPKWDWEKMIAEILLDAFNDQPSNLHSWVQRVLSMDIWNGNPPDEKTLKRKLKPLFERLSAD